MALVTCRKQQIFFLIGSRMTDLFEGYQSNSKRLSVSAITAGNRVFSAGSQPLTSYMLGAMS